MTAEQEDITYDSPETIIEAVRAVKDAYAACGELVVNNSDWKAAQPEIRAARQVIDHALADMLALRLPPKGEGR